MTSSIDLFKSKKIKNSDQNFPKQTCFLPENFPSNFNSFLLVGNSTYIGYRGILKFKLLFFHRKYLEFFFRKDFSFLFFGGKKIWIFFFVWKFFFQTPTTSSGLKFCYCEHVWCVVFRWIEIEKKKKSNFFRMSFFFDKFDLNVSWIAIDTKNEWKEKVFKIDNFCLFLFVCLTFSFLDWLIEWLIWILCELKKNKI